MTKSQSAKIALNGLLLGCASVLVCACASMDNPDKGPGSGVARVAAKPNHRQYFDQNRARYYYFDQTAHRYFWEDGSPRD